MTPGTRAARCEQVRGGVAPFKQQVDMEDLHSRKLAHSLTLTYKVTNTHTDIDPPAY